MPPPSVGSLVPGISYGIHKMLTTGIHQYRDTIMAFASRKCDFIELTSSIIDTTGASLTEKDKAKMFMDGIDVVKYYLDFPINPTKTCPTKLAILSNFNS